MPSSSPKESVKRDFVATPEKTETVDAPRIKKAKTVEKPPKKKAKIKDKNKGKRRIASNPDSTKHGSKDGGSGKSG